MTLRLPPVSTEMIRNILILVYAAVWGVAAVARVLQGETIPPEQWTALPMGVGGILLALRSGSKRDDDPEDK